MARSRWLLGVLIALGVCTLGASAASGATYCVQASGCTGIEAATLDEAIIAANASAGTDDIHLGAGTFTVSGAARRASGISIHGAGVSQTTVTLAEARTFQVNDGALNGLKLTGTVGDPDTAMLLLNRADLTSVQVTGGGIGRTAVRVLDGDLRDVGIWTSGTAIEFAPMSAANLTDTARDVRVYEASTALVLEDRRTGATDPYRLVIDRSRLTCWVRCVDLSDAATGSPSPNREITISNSILTLASASGHGADAAVRVVVDASAPSVTAPVTTSVRIANSTLHADGASVGTAAVRWSTGRNAATAWTGAFTDRLVIDGTTIDGFSRTAALSRDGGCIPQGACPIDASAVNSNVDLTSVDGTDVIADGGGNTNVVPRFVDVRAGDYRIPADSPLRDRWSCATQADITGPGVRTDGRCDVGAHEYVPAAPMVMAALRPTWAYPGGTTQGGLTVVDPNDPAEVANSVFTWAIPGIGTFTGGVATITVPSGTAPGNYPVTVSVTDSTGLTGTANLLLTVRPRPPAPPAPTVTFVRPDGTSFTCRAGRDYDPPSVTAGGRVPTMAQVRSRTPVRLLVSPSERATVTARMVASFTVRTSTGRLITRRVAFRSVRGPVLATGPVTLRFPISRAQRTTLTTRSRVGPIIWVASGIVRDPRGNARGFVKRLAGPLRLSVIPPRVDCGRSLPDVSAPGVVIARDQVIRSAAPRVRVTVNEPVRVSVRVVGRVNIRVGGARRTITYLLHTGAGRSTGAGPITVPLRANAAGRRAMRAAAARPGARLLRQRAYVVATDASGNTRKVSALVYVR